MVVVFKVNGKLRICLDFKDFNRVIFREYYFFFIIEDIVICFYGVKVFIKLDVRSGFWYIVLDEKLFYFIIF